MEGGGGWMGCRMEGGGWLGCRMEGGVEGG